MKEYSLYISHHAKKIFALERGAMNIKEQLKITGYQVVYHKTMNEEDAKKFIHSQGYELHYIGELYKADESGQAYLSYRFSPNKKPKQTLLQRLISWLN